MAAPAVSGLTLENTISVATDTITASSAFIVSAGDQRVQLDVTSGDTEWFEINFSSGAKNFTNKVLYFEYNPRIQSTPTGGVLNIGFVSSSNTHYRLWQTAYNSATDEAQSIAVVVDPTNTAGATTTGTFNVASVVGIRFQWTSSATGFGNRAGAIDFNRLDADQFLYSVPTTGLLLNAGESGNTLGADDVAAYLSANSIINTVNYGIYEGFGPALRIPFSLQIGSNSVVTLDQNTKLFVIRGNNLAARIIVGQAIKTITLNAAAGSDISNCIFSPDSGVIYNYEDISSDVIDVEAFVLNDGINSVDLGTSNYITLSVRNPTDSVSNGGLLQDVSIRGSTATGAAYIIRATTAVDSLTIRDSTSDFGIDLSAKSGTLDLTGLELSGNTFGSNILKYDSASDLTITVAADSGIATGSGSSDFGDATVSGGGTLTIEAPVQTTTFTGFPTVNNSNGVAPDPVIGFYSSSSVDDFIAGLDTSDPEYSAGSFTVLLSDYPGVTHVVGDAIGWIRTDYIPVDAGDPPSSVSLAAAFREILSETGVALVGNGTPELMDKLNYEQSETLFEVAAGPIDFESALDKKEMLTSPLTGLATFETAVVRAIQFVSSKYGNEILLPEPLTIAAAPNALTSPILTNFLVVRAGDPTEDPFEHGLASTAIGLDFRPEIRSLSTLFIGATEGGDGTGLGPDGIARLERIEQHLIADVSKGADRYKRFLPGTETVILDKDVSYDPATGFTLIEHQDPPP